MDQHAERMGLAYPAVTYGDLDPLCADLPAAGPVIARPRAAPHAAAPPAAAGRRGALAGVPTVPQPLWTIWLAAAAIDVLAGALARGTGGHLARPWPLWVAGPYRATLLVVPAGVTQIRHRRLSAARRTPGTASPEAPASLTS